MASSSGGYRHSGERSNSGRKRKYEEQNDCGKNHKRIYLESTIFQSWLRAKFDAGYESCSDSDFTAQLLIVVTTEQIFSSCMGIHENCFAFASYCTHFCIYRNLIQLPK